MPEDVEELKARVEKLENKKGCFAKTGKGCLYVFGIACLLALVGVILDFFLIRL